LPRVLPRSGVVFRQSLLTGPTLISVEEDRLKQRFRREL
jgi:hypothetical protein